jgi:hypothetical protein
MTLPIVSRHAHEGETEVRAFTDARESLWHSGWRSFELIALLVSRYRLSRKVRLMLGKKAEAFVASLGGRLPLFHLPPFRGAETRMTGVKRLQS